MGTAEQLAVREPIGPTASLEDKVDWLVDAVMTLASCRSVARFEAIEARLEAGEREAGAVRDDLLATTGALRAEVERMKSFLDRVFETEGSK